ncbi:hypothetical protein D3H55_22180 [Bacillus salacetis]|uniref:Uncharacterized protein n=1 Tax=Bacillus salacetis TaxID=2315464 RepID=A0A3A1QNF1_9BACI|nr:hypothetical protein [Bacillus salacetis]RIW28212.1 hypothetical protein D3H55_22180 [Bacillus salacetis]
MKFYNVIKQLKSLDHIRDHIKSQLLFHSLEMGEPKKVHFQRIVPIINRFLDLEKFKDVVQLLDRDSKETYAMQLIKLFSELGEFAKLPGGYFLPLPERTVELPRSKKLVSLSSTNKKRSIEPYIGLCSGYYSEKGNVPTLTLDEWMPCVGVSEFLHIIGNSQPYEIPDKPAQVFLPADKRSWDDYEKVKNRKIQNFIARYYVEQGPATYFWAQKTKSKTYFFQIPNNYLDIAKFAVERESGISRYVEVMGISGELVKMKFKQRIPLGEKKMLMLFAMPENLYDPFTWIVPVSHYEDFIEVVKKVGIKGPSVSSILHNQIIN